MKVNCTKKKNLNKTKYLTNFIYTAALFLLLSWKKKKKEQTQHYCHQRRLHRRRWQDRSSGADA